MKVESLHVYPFKSGPGLSVDAWEATARGFLHDRRFLVTDPAGRFFTQRTHPALGRPSVELTETGLSLDAPQVGELEVVRPPDGDVSEVEVWGDRVEALSCGPEADDWFAELLGEEARLYYMPDDSVRPADDHPDEPLSFADASPYLITNTASLDDLNRRIPGEPVPMAAFRPSIVVSGAPAWEEDGWIDLQIGAARFLVVGDCERCAITTLDPECPDRPRPDGEPLRTLATFRRNERGKVTFGRYAILRRSDLIGALIRVGDPISQAVGQPA